MAVSWNRESILFSSCNEDSSCELRAFGDLAGKRVLCVTAGGGRVLNLLPSRPKEIVAVDLNPAQNHLLELKIEAMRALGHEDYLRFLGVRQSSARMATYERLRAALSAEARAFFDDNRPLLEEGVLFGGRLERYLLKLSRLLQTVAGGRIERLFAHGDLEAQRRFVDRLDNRVFRLVAETACRRTTLGLFSGDPGFYRYVPPNVPVHEVIYGGVMAHFRHALARDNPLMQLIFLGRFANEGALPIYLNAATYDAARVALAEVTITRRTDTVHAVLEADSEGFDVFSLSDISSYLDDAAHEALFELALRRAKPGARLCSRSNLHHRPLTKAHAARLTRDLELEERLARDDHSCVHKFVVGEVS